jgi:phospholipase C
VIGGLVSRLKAKLWLIAGLAGAAGAAVLALLVWRRLRRPSPRQLPPMLPDPRLNGIDHFVVLMMENRSFDHYFGARSLVEGRAVEGLAGSEANPDEGGAAIQVHPLAELYPAPPAHEWGPSHEQWNLGQNDGFVRVQQHLHPGRYGEVMGY